MAHVAMSSALGHARHHRPDRLLAVKRLDLTLVNAEHERAVGQREISARLSLRTSRFPYSLLHRFWKRLEKERVPA